jgi:hypothetical protein
VVLGVEVADAGEDLDQHSVMLAKAKINLGRMLGVFQYNLPGGVSINFDSIKSDGKEELEAILKQIDDENTPSYFIQFN